MNKNCINIFVLFFLIFGLTGCSIAPEEENVDLMKEKTTEELQYIENAIFNITNKYAKGEYLKDDTLDWDSILNDEKRINEILDTIVLDMAEMDISAEDLILFSTELNNLLDVSINKEESVLLSSLQRLYNLVPQFFDKFSNDKSNVKDKELKSIVLSSYAFANVEDWEQAKNTINLAIKKYNEMMNDIDYMKQRSYSLNKIYVLLGEIKNVTDAENLGLFKLKFVNFIEKM